MQSSERIHLYSLDHLRALAAFSVLFWHAVHIGGKSFSAPQNWLMSFLEEGHTGVSLFFCITGFIFTILTTDRKIQYGPFLLNRFLRLFPLLFIVTLFNVWAEDGPQDSVLLFFNLLGGGAAFGAWTLAIEFQFYIAYPFLRDRIESPSLRRLLLNCLAIILLFFLLRLAFYAREHNAQMADYWTLFGRMDQFLMGIFAGHVFLRCKDMPRARWIVGAWTTLVVAVALLLLSVHWFNLSGGFYERGGYPSPSKLWLVWGDVEGVLYSAIIASYCLVGLQWSGRVSRLFSYLGAISYSTYMLHFLMLPMTTVLLREFGVTLFGRSDFAGAAFRVVLFYYRSRLMQRHSYEFIEKPFLARRTSYLAPRN